MRGSQLLRQVQSGYRQDYDALMSSGLYETLVEEKLLIPHQEIELNLALADGAYRVIQPEKIPFISYPYEWSFSQLKHAALITLRIQETALEHGMSLKDASAYNVQFHEGSPVLIDTLSFERYREGEPWVAYRQFCQHFLAPLALMGYRDVSLSQLLRTNIDGVSLELAASLLPLRTRLRPGLAIHIHAHAATQKKHQAGGKPPKRVVVPRKSVLAIVDSLRSAVRGLKWKPAGTEWGDYYSDTNYTDSGADHKRELVHAFLSTMKPESVWDLGANDGRYSRVAAELGAHTVAADTDPVAVELNYRGIRRDGIKKLLPLLVDLTNPSPAIGWAHQERDSMLDRGPADVVMGLALIHHLAISNNVPLPLVADFFARAGKAAIVEWVPKSDSQVQRLLATRQDIFVDYDRENFESAFGEFFHLEAAEAVRDSERVLYLFRRR